jgi:hypothetical protein
MSIAKKQFDKKPVSTPAPAPLIPMEKLEDYLKLAAATEYTPCTLLEQRLLFFFRNEGIQVYDLAEVEQCLDNLYGPAISQRKTWGWRPLRQKDSNKISLSAKRDWTKNGQTLN